MGKVAIWNTFVPFSNDDGMCCSSPSFRIEHTSQFMGNWKLGKIIGNHKGEGLAIDLLNFGWD